MDENCWNGWEYDRRMYEPTVYAVFNVVFGQSMNFGHLVTTSLLTVNF
jgi:hypothetical protein